MSKAAKQSIIILIFLLLGCLGFIAYTFIEKQKLQSDQSQFQNQLAESEERVKVRVLEIKSLKTQLKEVTDHRDQLKVEVDEAQARFQELQSHVTALSQERDQWKEQVQGASQKHDELMNRIRDLETTNSNLIQNQPQPFAVSTVDASLPVASGMDSPVQNQQTASSSESGSSDDHWAGILKDKAALEVQLEQLRNLLSEKAIEIVELKQKNTEIQMELSKFQTNREDFAREIDYKTDMIDNLSLELARTKNDKKFFADRISKLNEENTNLRKQVKDLVKSKGALEKSIVGLTQEKNKVQKELGKTETIIQDKIDEIWQIKDSLDKTFKSVKEVNNSDVELPSIVVSSNKDADESTAAPGFYGKVISINEGNNFVIIDIGQKAGLRLGDTLSVYRDSKYIARLEVIQLRPDIAAADVKEQWSKIQTEDIVR